MVEERLNGGDMSEGVVIAIQSVIGISFVLLIAFWILRDGAGEEGTMHRAPTGG